MPRLIAALFVALLSSVTIYAITADEIVANYLEARGGQAALTKLTSLRITGTLSMQGMEASFTQKYKNGSKVRMDIDMQGQTMTTAYDGKDAWMKSPFGGDKAQLAPPEQTSRAASEADYVGDLYNYKMRGTTIELIGSTDVNQSTAYKIKITKKDSSVTYTYIDAVTWMEVKTEEEAEMQGQKITVERRYSDFKKFGDVEFPTSIEVLYNGNPALGMTWKTVETNVPIDDAEFAFPQK